MTPLCPSPTRRGQSCARFCFLPVRTRAAPPITTRAMAVPAISGVVAEPPVSARLTSVVGTATVAGLGSLSVWGEAPVSLLRGRQSGTPVERFARPAGAGDVEAEGWGP